MDLSQFKRQAEYDNLDKEEQRGLLEDAKNGDQQAKNALIKSCMSLALSISLKYSKQYNEIEDAIQEAYLGLVEAVDKYNLDYSVKFSTYATYHVKYRVLHFLYNNNRISIPENLYKEATRYKHIKRELKKKLNKEPSIKEVAENSDFDYKKCVLYEKSLEDVLSYDFLMELTGNEAQYDVGDHGKSMRMKDILISVEQEVDSLPELQRNLIKDYYGIDSDSESLRQLSNKYNYSHEYIRKLIKEAVDHIKSNLEVNGYV